MTAPAAKTYWDVEDDYFYSTMSAAKAKIEAESSNNDLVVPLFRNGPGPRTDVRKVKISINDADNNQKVLLEVPAYLIQRLPTLKQLQTDLGGDVDVALPVSQQFKYATDGVVIYNAAASPDEIARHIGKILEYVDAGDVLWFKNGDTNVSSNNDMPPVPESAMTAMTQYVEQTRDRPNPPREKVSSLDSLIEFFETLDYLGVGTTHLMAVFVGRLLQNGNTTQDFAEALGVVPGSRPFRIPGSELNVLPGEYQQALARAIARYGPIDLAAVEAFFNSDAWARTADDLFRTIEQAEAIKAGKRARADERPRESIEAEQAAEAQNVDEDDNADDDDDDGDDDQ